MEVNFREFYTPKAKQAEAHACRAKYLLFGGAMGGGKSWFLCAEAIKNAMMFPGNRLVIVRKELSVLRKTILVTFQSICPSAIIANFNQSSLKVTFINGSVLYFLDANKSKDPLFNKLKGLEIGWFGIDEANEVAIEAYQILKTRLRWVLPNGDTPRYEGRLTSNPENCWLLPTFITSNSESEAYIQSLTSDNFDQESEYYQSLEETFKDNPTLKQKYLLGDWTLVDSINQLIPSKSLALCSNPIVSDYPTSLGIDPSRYGDDRTAFVLLKEGNVELIETYDKTSTNQIVTKTIELIEEYNIDPENVGIDGVGIGAGIIDSLNGSDYHVKELIGGEKPVEVYHEEAFKPFNLRSQMYYELRKDILAKQLGSISDPSLVSELSAIQYEISTEKTVKIATKEMIKKVYGKSPDIADALCYANWVKTWRDGFPYFLPISGGR